MLEVSIVVLSLLDFGTVLTMWYIEQYNANIYHSKYNINIIMPEQYVL